jgi:hypothetical protein
VDQNPVPRSRWLADGCTAYQGIGWLCRQPASRGESWKAARRDMPDDRQGAGEADLNRYMWTQANAEYTQAQAAMAWAVEEITWGIFNIPERQVGVLGNLADLDVIELGCGTAYFSAWLARRGARPVGVDVTPPSCAPRGSASARPGSSSRSSRQTPPTSRFLAPALTWRSPSAGRACGVTRPGGSPRPPGCCGPTAGWCSTPPASCPPCACQTAQAQRGSSWCTPA